MKSLDKLYEAQNQLKLVEAKVREQEAELE